MKLKFCFHTFLFFFSLNLFFPNHHFAFAQSVDPCGYDSDGDINDEDNCKIPNRPEKGAPNSNPPAAAANGPSGVPAGAAPASVTVATQIGPADTCPLNTKDGFGDEMKKILSEVKIACPDIGASTNIIDGYVAGYVNQNMNLPDGITCQNYSIVLKTQMAEAQKLGKSLNIQPVNAYSQCWISEYNSDSNITTYVMTDPNCLQEVAGPIADQINDQCGTVKKANYRDSSVTGAIQQMTNAISSSKNKACTDIAPQAIGLVGSLVGTTPIGIAGVSALQIFSGAIDKLLNHNRAKQEEHVKNFLKANSDMLRQSANACHYYNLLQGILGCDNYKDFKAPDGAVALSCTENQFSELKPARDSLDDLNKIFKSVSDPFTDSTVDLDDKKSTSAAKAKQAITDKMYGAIEDIMARPITFPDGSGDKGTFGKYLEKLAKDPPPPAPGQPKETSEHKNARKRLAALLKNIAGESDAYDKGNVVELKKQFLVPLLTVGDDPTKDVFSLDALTTNAEGLKAMMNHDLATDSKKKLDTAVANYKSGLMKSAQATFDADTDTTGFVDADKQNMADVKAFLAARVKTFTDFKAENNGAGPNNKLVMNIAENRAVQACTSLAPSFFYAGQGGKLYDSATNPNFSSDFSAACGPLFKDAPALARLNEPSKPAITPPTPSNYFNKNVCAAAGTKVADIDIPIAKAK